MASLVKNGKNYGLIWTEGGRQCRESLKTSDYTKAKRRKARLEDEYWDGDHDPFKKKWYERRRERGMDLGSAVEEFIKYKTRARGRQGWSETTAEKERHAMRNYAEIIGTSKALDEITNDDMERMYYRPRANSDHTRNSDYISMNTFFNWCIDRGYMKSKPDFKPGKPQAKIPKFIYPEELAGLIQYRIQVIRGDWKSGLLRQLERGAYWVPLGWMVLAGTGLRPIELANLKLKHIEKGSVIIGEDFTTKVKSERRVPLLFESAQAVALLTDPRFRSLEPYMKDSDYLLGRKPSHTKRKMSEQFSEAWQTRYPKKAKRTLYNLKDMFAVRFLSDDSVPSSSGMKLNELRQILGHSSLETTQKYLKALPFGTSLEGTIWDYAGKV